MCVEKSILDLRTQVGISLQQCCGLFWVQMSSLHSGLFWFVLHSSLSLLNTGVEGVNLIRAQTVHKVVLLPTGHHDWHLCDTGSLSFLGFAVGHRISQSQSPVGFDDRFSVVFAEQPADLLLEQDASLRCHGSPAHWLCWKSAVTTSTVRWCTELSVNEKRWKNKLSSVQCPIP